MTDQEAEPGLKAGEFLSNLRRRTAAMHTRLEQSGISKNLMSPEVDQEDYLKYLVAMRDLTSYTEISVFPGTTSVLNDLDGRRKLQWIDEDLNNFSRTGATNSEAYSKIELKTVGEKLGWIYVVEGSTLGGRLILKHLERNLHGLQETGARFLEAYGASTGMKWKGFLDQLSAFAIKHESEEEVISGAVKAFEAIYPNFNA